MKSEHSTEIRVRYKETDRMGVVYYSNYLVWFEVARTELFRSYGVVYKDLEEKGFFLPVVECSCRYKKSVRYDDLVKIVSCFSTSGRMRLRFDYKVKTEGRIAAEGYTEHVFVDEKGKPIPVPQEVLCMKGRKEEN